MYSDYHFHYSIMFVFFTNLWECTSSHKAIDMYFEHLNSTEETVWPFIFTYIYYLTSIYLKKYRLKVTGCL